MKLPTESCHHYASGTEITWSPLSSSKTLFYFHFFVCWDFFRHATMPKNGNVQKGEIIFMISLEWQQSTYQSGDQAHVTAETVIESDQIYFYKSHAFLMK